ncbi:hypothetical protein ACC806_34465 [Rhizobium ruizarguesonis]
MEAQTLELDIGEAARLYRKYREHRAYSTPIDQEIERIYYLISKGRKVIRALASIKAAGVSNVGLPLLGIARADAQRCNLTIRHDGSARMTSDLQWVTSNTAKSRYVEFPTGTFQGRHRNAEAQVPHIPPDIRPARGLPNYHILFEANWKDIPPDPMLLRRIGKGDTWLVCAAWDLTEIERAVLADRIGRTPA